MRGCCRRQDRPRRLFPEHPSPQSSAPPCWAGSGYAAVRPPAPAKSRPQRAGRPEGPPRDADSGPRASLALDDPESSLLGNARFCKRHRCQAHTARNQRSGVHAYGGDHDLGASRRAPEVVETLLSEKTHREASPTMEQTTRPGFADLRYFPSGQALSLPVPVSY